MRHLLSRSTWSFATNSDKSCWATGATAPAQNLWFVPCGRIRKNEKTQDALQRLARAELDIAPGPGWLLGIYDHFYDDNFYEVPGIGTHYLVCKHIDKNRRRQRRIEKSSCIFYALTKTVERGTSVIIRSGARSD